VTPYPAPLCSGPARAGAMVASLASADSGKAHIRSGGTGGSWVSSCTAAGATSFVP